MLNSNPSGLLRKAGLFIGVILTVVVPVAAAAEISDHRPMHALSRFYIEHAAWSRNCVDGFHRKIAGAEMAYSSPWPDVQSALLVRAQKAATPVRWETWPNSKSATRYLWMAGLGCSHREKNFFLTINGQDTITFTNSSERAWTAMNRRGDRLRFIAVDQDRHQDLFGFMILDLTQPQASALSLSVSSEPANEYSWFMIFQTNEILAPFAKAAQAGFYYELAWSEKEGCRVTLPQAWRDRKVLWREANGRNHVPVFVSAGDSTAKLPGWKPALARWPLTLYLDGVKRDVLAGLSESSDTVTLRQDSLLVLRTGSVAGDRITLQNSGLYSRLVPSLLAAEQARSTIQHIDLMSSSHQDIAWMDTPHQCMLDRDSKVLTPALALLQKNSEFCYSAEQVLMLQEYLSLHPEAKALIHELTRSGRLEWGATYNQPYEGLYNGEELVRQLYHGRIWLQKTLPGCDARVAWNVDVPGRTLQMPQILAKSGVPYMFISRHEPGLFYWQSPDGSRVGVYSPGQYHENSNFMRQPSFRIVAALPHILSDWSRFDGSQASPAMPVLVSTDMGAPFDYEPLRQTWNALRIEQKEGGSRALQLPQMGYATATTFMDRVFSSRPALPILQGERPNVWLYIHGPTHHWAIDYHRQAGQLLPAAEKFNAILATMTGTWAHYPETDLDQAWESAIYPDHGWGGKNGETTDSTFLAKFRFARDTGRHLLDRALQNISQHISGQAGPALRLLLFNDLAFARQAPIQVPCDFPRGWCRDVQITNSSGKTVPHQWRSRDFYDDHSLHSGELLLIADEVPSLGYETMYIRPAKSKMRPPAETNKIVETDHYRLTLSEGGVAGLFDKDLNVDIARTDKFLFGELFSMTSVGNGAGEFAEVQQPTMQDFEKISHLQPAWQLLQDGPVAIVLQLRQKLAHVSYKMTLTAWRHCKQIDFTVDLDDWDGTRNLEYRLAFPLNLTAAQVSYAVPFGAVTVGRDELAKPAGERYLQLPAQVRPREVQDWISATDDRWGATFSSSVAVWDFQDPTTGPAPYPVLQPVLLASRKSCHWEGNWYLQKGSHHFSFTLRSHTAGWQNGYHAAISANTPLYPVWQRQTRTGTEWPDRYSFLQIANPNIHLSTLKKARESNELVMRVYEMEGRDSALSWSFHSPVPTIARTNLVEEADATRPDLSVGHHAIETFRFRANSN